ncbi:MAG: protein kinase [Myxococcota bacterium]
MGKLYRGYQIGRYVVEGLLGTGGSAQVWRVRHLQMGTLHALKVLLPSEQGLRARLLREGRAQSLLDHPHILPVRDVLRVFDNPALLMPLVEGPSLRALLAHAPLRRAESLSILLAMAEGLAFAHQHGFVHRDLKPANVLLDFKPSWICPRIGDFGLVKDAAVDLLQTRTGAFLGTPAYAAPEQLIDASSVDGRADLFSLGVMMVELLAGHRPFQQDAAQSALAAQQQPPDLRGMDEPGLIALAEALLQPDPADRLPDAESFAVRLRALGAEAPQQVLAARSPVWDAAHRLAAALAVPATVSVGLHAPPSRPLPSHNLPGRQDRFIGRGSALDLLAARIADGQRLLTLTGPGGSGKTRLATELGRQTLSRWPGGVWFIDLSEARDEIGVFQEVARALDVPLHNDPRAQLGHILYARGPVLCIFDNFEQIVDCAANTVGRWLDETAEMVAVVTSRQPLWLSAEQVVVVEPLTQDEALALFSHRARAVGARLAEDAETIAQIGALVNALERLPLAIELAAARARTFSPAQLMARLSDRFALLSTRSRERPARQRNLWATLQWSWDLLRPWEQSALAQISVFEGGFTFEAAEQVVALERAGEPLWLDEVLSELVDRNLLRPAEGGRLRMLETMRRFADAQLVHTKDATRRRHGQCYAQLGRRILSPIPDEERIPLIAVLNVERENLLAAHQHALAQRDAALAVACVGILHQLFLERAPSFDLYPLLQRTQKRCSLDGFQDACVMLWSVQVLKRTGRHDAALQIIARLRALLAKNEAWKEHIFIASEEASIYAHQGDFARGEAILRAELKAEEVCGSLRGVGVQLGNLAMHIRMQGRLEEAEAMYKEAIAVQERSGVRRSVANNRGRLALLYVAQGRREEALREMHAALAYYQESGIRDKEGAILSDMADLYAQKGDFTAAKAMLEAAGRLHRLTGDAVAQGVTMAYLSDILRKEGQHAQAHALARSAIDLFRRIERPYHEAYALGYLGRICGDMGALEDGRRHFGRAIEMFQQRNLLHAAARIHLFRAELELRAGATAAARAAFESADASTVPAPLHDLYTQLKGALSRAGQQET